MQAGSDVEVVKPKPPNVHLSKKEQAKADGRRRQLQSAIEKGERVTQDQRNRLANLERRMQGALDGAQLMDAHARRQAEVNIAQHTAVEKLLGEKESMLVRLRAQLRRDFPATAED